MTASATGKRLQSSGKRIARGSLKQYHCVHHLLTEFEAGLKSPVRIHLLNKSSLKTLEAERKYWKRFFRNFNDFLVKKKYFDHYMAAVFKTLKTFFNYLLHEKSLPVGSFHKQFRLPQEKLTPIVLEPYQLKFFIADKPFDDSLPKALKRTKDIFVFGCTVGLRFSDLMALRKQDVQYTEAGNFIIVSTKKTTSEVRIPLPDYLVEIIERYKRSSGKFVLPRLSNVNLNKQVKLLVEKAGWTYNLPKIRHRQGKGVELKNESGNCFRFCDHITTHTMRRTAITTLLMMGVPEMMVRRISGHAAGSKEFYKYVAVVQNYLNEKVIGAYDKLMNL